MKSGYINFCETLEEQSGTAQGLSEVLVECGKAFISFIRDKDSSAQSFADVSSRLNALSGLNVLSQRMTCQSENQESQKAASDSKEKIADISKANSATAPNSAAADSKDAANSKDTNSIAFENWPGLARFLGGVVIARRNVLLGLNEILLQLTEGHRDHQKVLSSIRDGSDINAKQKGRRTAIFVAAEKGQLDSVTALIEAKADIHATDLDNQTVLHSAAKAGNAELVRTLVKSKADVNALDKTKKTPFDLATDVECMYALKAMGAGEWTAFMVAAERGDDSIRQYFYVRDCIRCMSSMWTWARHCENIAVSKDGKSAYCASYSNTGGTSALGSHAFNDENIYTWEMSVDWNVPSSENTMDGNSHLNAAPHVDPTCNVLWVGICSSIKVSDRLNWSPQSEFAKTNCDLLIACCSNGENVCTGAWTESGKYENESFNNQKLSFTVDLRERTFEMRIGGKLAFSAKDLNVGSNGVWPYICLDGCATVKLHSSELPIRNFPSEFQNDVRFYSSLSKKEAQWAWGAFNKEEIISNDLEVKKAFYNYQFACAVGNEEFGKGIFGWDFAVERSHRMWVGVVRGKLEQDDLLCSPYECKAEFIFAYGSDGQSCRGQKFDKNTKNESRWPRQHNKISLKLDTHKRTLEIFANNVLICKASELDDKGLRAYVCIEYYGSILLENRVSMVVDTNSSMISFKDRAMGLENKKWTDEEVNMALLKLHSEGVIKLIVFKYRIVIFIFANGMSFVFAVVTPILCYFFVLVQEKSATKSSTIPRLKFTN